MTLVTLSLRQNMERISSQDYGLVITISELCNGDITMLLRLGNGFITINPEVKTRPDTCQYQSNRFAYNEDPN